MNLKLSRAPAGTRENGPISAYSREIHGYHGCDRRVADQLLAGDPFIPSSNSWDWLGNGIYFWEYGPDRAYRWAEQQPRIERPAVLGAVIQLGRCLDLLDTRFTRDLEEFYPVWVWMMTSQGAELPENRGKARYLDQSVVNAFLLQAERMGVGFDTVRAVFVEGEPVYPGSAIHSQTHIQVAVRNPQCIIGVFRPTRLPRNGADEQG